MRQLAIQFPEMTDSQVLAATDSQSLAAAAGEDDTEKAS